FGERIDIHQVLGAIRQQALDAGWESDTLSSSTGAGLPALRRVHSTTHRHIYISSGIHGDEPAGPLAIQRLLREGRLPSRFNYSIVPCLNPGGFERGTRENEAGIDLNRDYK